MKNFSTIRQVKYLLVMITVFAFVSCVDNANIVSPPPIAPKPYVPPVTNPTVVQIDLPNLRSLISSRVATSFSNTDDYDGKIGNYLYYNYERMIVDEVIKQNDEYQIPNLNTVAFSHNLAVSIVPVTYTGATFNISSISGVSTYYNSTQISLLNAYFNNMFLATSALKASIYYSTAKSATEQSSLSTDQKIAVIGLIETGNEFANAFFAGSWNSVYSNLQAQINSTSGRTQTGPCTVNFKQVWLSGITGGVIGAVRGAMVGAAGGTIAIPLLGTATGAVGGGVFGFAIGFLGGSAEGVVQELMSNCIFKEEGIQPNAKCSDFKYSTNHPDQCVTEMNQLKKWYVLNVL